MVIYCLLYYRLLGVITILSLVLSGGLVYAIMVLLGRWIGPVAWTWPASPV